MLLSLTFTIIYYSLLLSYKSHSIDSYDSKIYAHILASLQYITIITINYTQIFIIKSNCI